MRLLLCPSKNETAPVECCVLVEETLEYTATGCLKKSSRIVHSLLPIDLFLNVDREIYDRLRGGEEVEIEIKITDN